MTQIQHKRGTAAALTAANATYAAGEIVVETDTLKFKIGDGATAWATLAYQSGYAPGGTDVAVADGGTGVSSLTDHGVMLGSGTGAVTVTAPGTAGQPLVSGGAGADPDWGTLSAGAGGTGATSLTDHSVLLGSGTAAVTPTAVGATGEFLAGVTGADPVWTSTIDGGVVT